MKTEEKNSVPRVRIAVLGNVNVGKSGNVHKNHAFRYKNTNRVHIKYKQIPCKIEIIVLKI